MQPDRHPRGRLAGRMFTLASAVSLPLCVAACGLWGRSYGVADCLVHNVPGERTSVLQSARGRVIYTRVEATKPRDVPLPEVLPDGYHAIRPPAVQAGGQPAWEYAGFSRTDEDLSPFGMHIRGAAAPHWTVVAATAALPAAWAAGRGRRWHRARGGPGARAVPRMRLRPPAPRRGGARSVATPRRRSPALRRSARPARRCQSSLH